MMMKEWEAIAADSLNDDRFHHFGKIWQENEKAKQLRHRGGASKVGKLANEGGKKLASAFPVNS